MLKRIPLILPSLNAKTEQQTISSPPISEEITILSESWNMHNGDYVGTIQECRCYYDKKSKRKILMKIRVENQADMFLQSFPCALFTSSPLGQAIKQIYSDVRTLNTDDLVDRKIAFKVENRLSNDKAYSNITEIKFIEEERA